MCVLFLGFAFYLCSFSSVLYPYSPSDVLRVLFCVLIDIFKFLLRKKE